MSDFKNRPRRVNLDQLSSEDSYRIGVELGKKAGKILSKAEQDLNQILKAYGVRVQVAVKFINSETGKESEVTTFNQQEEKEEGN